MATLPDSSSHIRLLMHLLRNDLSYPAENNFFREDSLHIGSPKNPDS